jgi:hypothetical protein
MPRAAASPVRATITKVFMVSKNVETGVSQQGRDGSVYITIITRGSWTRAEKTHVVIKGNQIGNWRS